MERGDAGFFYVLRTRIPLARSLTVPDRKRQRRAAVQGTKQKPAEAHTSFSQKASYFVVFIHTS